MKNEPIKAAQAAAEAVAKLPIGASYADAEARAVDAIDAADQQAIDEGFPCRLDPCDAGAVSVFFSLTGTVRFQAAAVDLARLHEMAIDGWPQLAAIIRGPIGMHVLDGAAATAAPSIGQATATVITASRREFRRLVAEQVLHRDPACVWARALAVELPAIEAQLQTAIAAHKGHAAAELARVKREADEADAAVARVRADQRSALAAFFSSRPNFTFEVAGRLLSGNAAAAILRGHGARDAEGNFVSGPQIGDFDLAMRRAEAAAAVTA